MSEDVPQWAIEKHLKHFPKCEWLCTHTNMKNLGEEEDMENHQQEKQAEFRKATLEVAKYLRKYHHPHTIVVIDDGSAELYEGIKKDNIALIGYGDNVKEANDGKATN